MPSARSVHGPPGGAAHEARVAAVTLTDAAWLALHAVAIIRRHRAACPGLEIDEPDPPLTIWEQVAFSTMHVDFEFGAEATEPDRRTP